MADVVDRQIFLKFFFVEDGQPCDNIFWLPQARRRRRRPRRRRRATFKTSESAFSIGGGFSGIRTNGANVVNLI